MPLPYRPPTEFERASCNFVTTAKICSWESESNLTNCATYSRDDSYYFLIREKNNLVSREKYCLKLPYQLLKDIKEKNYYIPGLFFQALFFTVVVEFVTAIYFFMKLKKPVKLLYYVITANLISLPVVWFVFPLFGRPSNLLTLSSEVFAFLFEALFIYLLNKRFITLKQSLILSFLTNFISYTTGVVFFNFY